MLRFIGERALHAVVVVILAATGAFFLMEAVPGDSAASAVGPGATAEQYQLAREELGLDKPVLERFGDWASGLLSFDLGNSLVPPNQAVSEMIGNALPVTIQLAFLAITLSLAIAVPVAVWSAYRRGGVFDQVASLAAFFHSPTAGIIALQTVRDQGKVAAGHRVLVNGAAGGVGSLAVQIARADGATVTAVDGPGRVDLLRSIGADHVIDHTREDFTRGAERYDVVVDIPGNHPFAEVRRTLAPGGTYVLVGHDQYGREGRRVLGSIPRMFSLMARAPFTDQVPRASFSSRPKLEHLHQLADLAEAGQLRPVIDRTFPLEEAAAALEHLASGEGQGRVVLVTEA